MSSILALGLLMAGFCPTIFCFPGDRLEQKTLTLKYRDNRTRVGDTRLASSNADFAFSLYKQLAQTYPSKNIVFSPVSVSTALAFVSLGARGTTLTEILEGLRFNLTETPEAEIHQGFQHLLRTLRQPSDQLQLSTDNAMFITEELEVLDKFLEDAGKLYEALPVAANFQDPAAIEKAINHYVEKKTKGKIKDLVKGLGSDTKMLLVNYIYFKANWKTPFDPDDTFESRFYVSKNKWVEVPMMNIEDLTTPYFRDEALSCTVVEMKYTGKASALFILPDEDQMEALEAKLNPETLRRWRDSLQMTSIDELYLPKFSISSNYHLEKLLPALGIREIFSHEADLSGITGAKDLKVSEVVHKAVLDVGELGTEAAAATSVKIVPLAGKVNPLIVSFDKPFLMAIVHADTQSVLFLSKITNPLEP
ncbi:alpha-1-antichymotrypsin-like [Ctenodactylus gundi]